MKIMKSVFNGDHVFKSLVLACLMTLSVACGSAADLSGGDSDSDDSTVATTAFPSDLAVASPLDASEDEGSTDLSLSSVRYATSGGYVPKYAVSTAIINDILTTSSASLCDFDPSLFLVKDDDAGCYGPSVDYEDHPDWTASSTRAEDGELPPLDVGIWNEIDDVTGDACMAAELEARMGSMSSKGEASLTALASMICVINNSGGALSMPSSSTLTLNDDDAGVTYMDDLAIIDIAFTDVTLTHAVNSDGNNEYSYHMTFTYSPGSDSYDIVVDMEHVPGASALEYTGQVSYLVDDTFNGGNCPDSDVTYNGSLQYVRGGLNDMDAEVREGTFCGHGADGRGVDNLIDPSDKYSGSNLDGWGNNFSIFTTNYNPITLEGDYAYSWMAGPEDGNSRIFNVHVEEINFAATDVTAAIAYYGYGDDIEDTDGSIQGFICNWAGPNSSHTLSDSAQYQAVSFDHSLGLFTSLETDIEYAPTLSCEYDGSGTFIYDTDGDGSLSDESNVAITQDLSIASDIDGDGNATMPETIEDAGFTLPTI